MSAEKLEGRIGKSPLVFSLKEFPDDIEPMDRRPRAIRENSVARYLLRIGKPGAHSSISLSVMEEIDTPNFSYPNADDRDGSTREIVLPRFDGETKDAKTTYQFSALDFIKANPAEFGDLI